MIELKRKESKDDRFQNVKKTIFNPKAITMGELYGEVNEISQEWHDGLASKMMRQAANESGEEKNWIVFDGPVDALWIENMNTVLDDNKKLCLNSGQIITLTSRMTMMFEVEDLSVASPATVSRCGMVYMEPGSLTLSPLVKSWINSIPLRIRETKSMVDKLQNLFDKYIDDSIYNTRKNLPEPVKTVDNNIAQSIFRIIDCYFSAYNETEIKKITKEELANLDSMLN
jgi:dynein heavy chain